MLYRDLMICINTIDKYLIKKIIIYEITELNKLKNKY